MRTLVIGASALILSGCGWMGAQNDYYYEYQNASYGGVISNIPPGQTVTLVFDVALPHYSGKVGKNGFVVTWNGEQVAKSKVKSGDGWQTISVELTGSATGVNELVISGFGKNDDKGAVIDNVALIGVP